MDWMRKLERKYSKYSVPYLINYIVIGQVFVYLYMLLINVNIYQYISLWRAAVLQGQVWRLVTFVFAPASTDMLWFALSAYFYYFIGQALEYAWGSFRLNVYVLCGMVGSILSCFLLGYANNDSLLTALFLAYAMLYPEREILFMFVLRVKVKWLGWLAAAQWLYVFVLTSPLNKGGMLLGMAGFLLFFGKDFWNAGKAKIRRERWRRKNRNNWR